MDLNGDYAVVDKLTDSDSVKHSRTSPPRLKVITQTAAPVFYFNVRTVSVCKWYQAIPLPVCCWVVVAQVCLTALRIFTLYPVLCFVALCETRQNSITWWPKPWQELTLVSITPQVDTGMRRSGAPVTIPWTTRGQWGMKRHSEGGGQWHGKMRWSKNPAHQIRVSA